MLLLSCRSPGLVKEFIADLHSGKLHREFHHGPDPVVQQEKQVEQVSRFIVIYRSCDGTMQTLCETLLSDK
jgi:hypothetical protein